MTDLAHIDTSDVPEFLLHNAAHESILILGGIGIGKTYQVEKSMPLAWPALVAQVAEKRDITIEPGEFELFERRAGEYDVLDYAGLPVPHKLPGQAIAYQQKRAVSDIWPGAGSDKKVWGVLFLDEFPQADRNKQTVMQRAFDQGVVGDWVVPGHPKSDPNCERGLLFIVLAGNRQSDRANSHGVGWQTANRLLQVIVEPTAKGWIEWAQKNGVDPSVIALVKFYPEYVHKVDVKQKDALMAAPTPRSLVKLSDAVKRNLPRSIEFSTYAGLVGEECARAFMSMLDASREVDFEKALIDPANAPIADRAVYQYATAAALTRYVDEDNFDNVVEYLSRVGDGEFTSPELLVFAVDTIVARLPHLAETAVFTDYSIKWKEYRT